MSKQLKLHPVTIMLGLLIFGYFFGIVGMVVATPAIAAIKVIFTFILMKNIILHVDLRKKNEKSIYDCRKSKAWKRYNSLILLKNI